MTASHNRVCPVEMAGSLDNRLRKWVQNPEKILSPFVRDGMVALDLGCGPGFFTIPMAHLVGPAGKVIAADLQEGMLRKVQAKIKGTVLEQRVALHLCGKDKTGLNERCDFILMFYMLHEVPDAESLFGEIIPILKDKGCVLIIEPPLHVTKRAFAENIRKAVEVGLTQLESPKVFLSKSALLQKG